MKRENFNTSKLQITAPPALVKDATDLARAFGTDVAAMLRPVIEQFISANMTSLEVWREYYSKRPILKASYPVFEQANNAVILKDEKNTAQAPEKRSRKKGEDAPPLTP